MTDQPPDAEMDDQPVAEQLTRSRPVPRASFRGALARHLIANDPGYGPRPARLWIMIAASAAGGLVLILAGLVIALSTG